MVRSTHLYYTYDPPLREQDLRRGLILLARRPAEGHSLSEGHSFSGRYIAVTKVVKVAVRLAKYLASCSMCVVIVCFDGLPGAKRSGSSQTSKNKENR